MSSNDTLPGDILSGNNARRFTINTSINAQEQLPLTEATFFILLSLAPGPKHGYAIMKETTALSDGRITLSTGTLYGALGRLLDRGWVERRDNEETEESGRPRKDYALTALGRRILQAETERLQSLVMLAQPRLAEEQS